MTDELIVQFIIDLNEPELDEETTQRKVQNLLNQLRHIEGVERIERTQKTDLQPAEEGELEGRKNVFEFIVGLLTAEVNTKNLKTFLGFIGDRFGNKPLKLKVKVKDKEVELEASSREELLTVQEIAEEMIKKLLLEDSKENSNG